MGRNFAQTGFEYWLKMNGYKVKPCNCGGPQYGTDHSPDCEFELSALDLQDQFDDEMEERYDYDDSDELGLKEFDRVQTT